MMIKKLLLILAFCLVAGCATQSRFASFYPEYLTGNEILIERTAEKEVWERPNGQRIAFYTAKVRVYPNTTTTYYTDEDDCDGELSDGGDCGRWVDNTSTTMRLGVDGSSKCITDNQALTYRAYSSFDTSDIGDGTITSATAYFYVDSITKPKRFNWNALYDADIDIAIANDQIDGALDTTDWGFGSTDKTINTVPSSAGYIAGGFTVDNDDINTDGDTDFELRPNQDWYDDLHGQGKEYRLNIRTNEYGGGGDSTRPHLVIVYTPAASDRRVITVH